MLLGVSFQSGISSESLERVTDVVTYSEIHTRGPQAGPATLFRPALRHPVQQMFMLSDVYYNTISQVGSRNPVVPSFRAKLVSF